MSDFDGDGDGYTTCEDCYDLNTDAFPGQTEYFEVDRGDGSFDYDCDGSESPMGGACQRWSDAECDSHEGWEGNEDSSHCGEFARWGQCAWGGMFHSCRVAFRTAVTLTQSCR